MIPLPLLAFFSPFKKVFGVALDICNAVPGWIWAAALLALWLHGCGESSALHDLRKVHTDLITQVKAQNLKAQTELSAANSRVKALQDELTANSKRKDVQDVENLLQLDALGKQLRNARIAGRLRDPNATGQSSSSACPAAIEGSANSDPDRAETTGLLSEPLTELLLTDAADADRINTAYARCRSDFRELTQQYDAWRATIKPSE